MNGELHCAAAAEGVEQRPLKRYIILKILAALFYAAITAFILYGFIGGVLAASSPEARQASLAVFVIFFLVYGGLLYIVPFLISLLGLIFSSRRVKAGECVRSTVIYFAVFTALPVITWIATFLFAKYC